MLPDPALILALLALGAVVGLCAGLFGIGGGGIMVPTLTSLLLALDVPVGEVMHAALGTSMTCIVATAIASARAHHRQAGVHWRVVAAMAPGVVLGTLLATWGASRANTLVLGLIFAVFMSGVAVNMAIGRPPAPARRLPHAGWQCLVGSAIGGVSALVAIGGGTLSVPYLHWHNLPLRHAIGTSAAIGVPIALSGALGYLWHGMGSDLGPGFFGYIYVPAVLLISLTSVLCAPLGVRLAYRLPTLTVKKVFALLLAGLSLHMLFSLDIL